MRAGLPLDAPEVDDVCGEPHAGVVVEVAGGFEVGHKAIHAGEGGGGVREVGGQIGFVIGWAETGFGFFTVEPDAVTQLLVEALPVVSPGKFGDELFGVATCFQGLAARLSQGENAVAEIGGPL